MLRLTPKAVRLVLLPASYLTFLVGMLTSGASFYRGKPFDPKAAILSDMQSPDENPHGFGASAVGTALSAILLGPAATVFYLQLRKGHPLLAAAGLVMFTAGIVSAVAVGILAPFTHGYTPLHVQLASAAFIGISAGTWLHLLAARAAWTLLVVQLATVVLLIFLCYGPVNFRNDRLLTSLAFWEWVLCLNCGLALCVLAKRIQAKSDD
jgi:hypothetical protein